MRGARLREKLANGGIVINLGMAFHSPAVVEMLAQTDADGIWLDAEHGPISEGNCEEMIRAADLYDKPVIIRVPHNDEHTILRYLDIGASGLIIPHVTTPEDAQRAVQAMRYGPEGRRSFAGGRASRYGRQPAAEYIQRANREILVQGLFEDVAGLPHLDEILATPGLDALTIGPNDLAFSMGYPAQPWHPEVGKVIDQVVAACRRAGKATGLPATDSAQARQHVERGCQILSMNVPNIIIDSTRRLVQQIHG